MGISAGAGAAIAGGLGAAGSLGSGMIGASGSKSSAATNLAALQYQEQVGTPYANVGTGMAQTAENEIWSGQLGAAAPTDMSAIQNMPGYQFTLQQGLANTQNAAAAKGLGVSGAALMGAANYATGLANSNFQNYFNDYWSNQNNRYNMLSGLASIGENAAVGTGSNVGSSASAAGNAQANAGTAMASGVSGASNSLSNALTTYFGSQNQNASTIQPQQMTGYAPSMSPGQVGVGGFVAQ